MDMMVFLGDYVDRGNRGVENLCLILEKFLKNPKKIIILRGNHETPWPNERYGFMSEVRAKFGATAYEHFAEFFASMPYAVVVNGHLCVHGGIARTLTKVEEIAKLHLPDRVPDNPVAYELLWNDPDENAEEFDFSERGPRIYKYGRKVTENFIKQNELKGIIRGHEKCDAFKFNFGGQVTTVFSSKYHGASAGILLLQKGFREYVKL